ncbi:peptide ABC transporter substrate-binding protein [Microbacterium esteraromaticum]|uniref:Peptide ABC transporter substrate-binding protein n=1 Tax=Microbacterium esteraromaticum TaxID=57043 RepID=A0A7D8AJX4_9MICO|nr:peptide ABC transporter substrate-binding protein [Microbacterium esteraromaticum]QMU97685.1 peptide ABC transporter substrate-binding protein [Microbacterium esteraromaticum]
MKLIKPLIGLGAAFAFTVGSLSAAGAAQEAEPSVIRLATNMDQVDTLNPFTAVFNEAIVVLDYEYEPLAGIGPSGDYEGILADEFDVEGTTWTYHIRDAAKWSDGEPVVADDVVWTYEAIMNDKALQVANGESVGNIKQVTAEDEKTVVFETNSPTPLHPGILPIVPKHIWEDIENPAEYQNTEDVVGSGPFIIDDFNQGTSITLKANEHYWKGKPGVDGLDLIGFKNTDASVLALRNGEIDMLGGLSSAQFESLKSVSGLTTYQVTSKHFWDLQINPGWTTVSGEPFGTQHKVLEDQAFRQAVAQAIDSETLVDRVLNGLGSTGPTIIPPGAPGGFFTKLEGKARPQGTDEAIKSLEAAGYTTDAQGNRLDKDGNPITLRLMFNGTNTQNNATAEFIVSWMKDLGITIESNSSNWDVMSPLITKGDYDMYINGWGVGQDPDYQLSINVCSTLPDTPGADNASQAGVCDPEYDKLFQAQHTELDRDTRAGLIEDSLQRIYDWGTTNILYYDDSLGAYNSDRLDNLVEVMGSPYNRFSVAQATIKGADSGSGDVGAADSPWLIWTIAGVVAVLIIIALIVMASRRKKTADDRQ